ncbi:MAG: DUF5335 family protein [Chloroflexi bacterium]|nr:DUF5335 family protein [Chloroflexota bacterium]
MKRTKVVTREIPKTEWNDFCNEFSRRHQGWLANVEINGEVKIKESPFKKISLSKDGRQTKAAIVIDGQARKSVKHTVDGVALLRLEQDKAGNDQGLTVETKSGAKTILRFINSAFSR